MTSDQELENAKEYCTVRNHAGIEKVVMKFGMNKTLFPDPELGQDIALLAMVIEGMKEEISKLKKAAAKSYTLKDDRGNWLAQVVLTDDGMFSAVSEWGNFSFAWRHFGDCTFREFLLELNDPYFGDKMINSYAFITTSQRIDAKCRRFAEKILPALQAALKEEQASRSVNENKENRE